jgi:uncharacterized membrane protein YphA (DoxX/SURF4 family)
MNRDRCCQLPSDLGRHQDHFGILLVVGLWTPIAGTLVVIAQVWSIFDKAGDLWAHLLLGIIGASLALLGPGFWSVDARLFGWKRIDLRER